MLLDPSVERSCQFREWSFQIMLIRWESSDYHWPRLSRVFFCSDSNSTSRISFPNDVYNMRGHRIDQQLSKILIAVLTTLRVL